MYVCMYVCIYSQMQAHRCALSLVRTAMYYHLQKLINNQLPVFQQLLGELNTCLCCEVACSFLGN
jgi:hypothetical protein